MRGSTNQVRGFTLIELMIVVAILAILAAVAIVAYKAYIERSRNSEATSILADIRIKQDSYRATFHQYANPSGNGSTWIPDAEPSSQSRSWTEGVDDELLQAWNQLGVRPDHGVYFSYMCIAGTPGSTVGDPFGDMEIEETNDFWYAARAMQNVDDSGECAGFEIYTGKMQVVDLNEGEVPCP